MVTVVMVKPHYCCHGEDGGEGAELVDVPYEVMVGRVTQGDEGERCVAVWNHDDLLGPRLGLRWETLAVWNQDDLFGSGLGREVQGLEQGLGLSPGLR